jgi:hypothetical protein
MLAAFDTPMFPAAEASREAEIYRPSDRLLMRGIAREVVARDGWSAAQLIGIQKDTAPRWLV